MRIGVLKESAPRERRVALTPDAVVRLVKRGLEVVIDLTVLYASRLGTEDATPAFDQFGGPVVRQHDHR